MYRHRIPGILFLTWLTVGGACPALAQQPAQVGGGYNAYTGRGQPQPPQLNHFTGGSIPRAQVGQIGRADGNNHFTGKQGRPPSQANHFTGKEYMPGITALPGPDSPNAPPRASYNTFTAAVKEEEAKENAFTGDPAPPFIPPAGLANAAEVPNDFTGKDTPTPPARNALTGQPMQPLSAGMAGVAMPRRRAASPSAEVNSMTGKARPPAATYNRYTGKAPQAP